MIGCDAHFAEVMGLAEPVVRLAFAEDPLDPGTDRRDGNVESLLPGFQLSALLAVKSAYVICTGVMKQVAALASAFRRNYIPMALSWFLAPTVAKHRHLRFGNVREEALEDHSTMSFLFGPCSNECRGSVALLRLPTPLYLLT